MGYLSVWSVPVNTEALVYTSGNLRQYLVYSYMHVDRVTSITSQINFTRTELLKTSILRTINHEYIF